MHKLNSSMAQQIAEAAPAFEQQRRSVTAEADSASEKETSHELALSPMPVKASKSQGSRPMRKRNGDGFEGILFTGALK